MTRILKGSYQPTFVVENNEQMSIVQGICFSVTLKAYWLSFAVIGLF